MVGWLGTWAKRVKITISKTNIGEDLTDFPVLLNLSTSCGTGGDDLTFIFTEITTNYLKMAVTKDDGTTELYAEVEKWDNPNKIGCLWVKVPSVTTAVDTILYLYYDGAHADNPDQVNLPNTAAAEHVWNAAYRFVSHMLDDPDTSHIRDSTSNNKDGTKRAANSPTVTTSGKIGNGQTFEGTIDEIPTLFAIGDLGQEFTVECWLYPHAQGNYDGAWGWQATGGGKQGTAFQYTTDQWLVIYGTGIVWITFAAGLLNLNAWNRVTVVVKTGVGGYIKVYKGAAAPTSGPTSTPVSYPAEQFRIGRAYTAADRLFDGMIDEFRVSLVERSANWIKACYYSETDALNDWGAEEAGGVAAPTVTTEAATNLEAD